MFENPRRRRQARNFTTNVPKILDLKSSSEQIFFRKLSLGAPAPGVQFPDKAPKRRLKIKKNMCVTNATGGLLVYQVLHSRVKFKHNFDTKG